MSLDEDVRTDAELIAASLSDLGEFEDRFVRYGSPVHRYLARRPTPA